MIVENQRCTTQIVAAYVRRHPLSTEQIPELISSVHSTLSGLGKETIEEHPRVPAVSVRRSVRADYIICIECGYKGKMLKRHLQSRHGFSANEYRVRWKLSSDYPMTAPNYSERRSQLARDIGLGRGGRQPAAIAAATRPVEAIPEKPARRSANKATKIKTSRRMKIRKGINKTRQTSPKTTTRETRLRTSAKTTSNRSKSRKPPSRRARKAPSARKAAIRN